MKTIFSLTVLLTLSLVLHSCKKVEGPGGTSTIKGVIQAELYNTVGTKIGEYPKELEDVYIVYGDGTTYSDKFTTSYDGSFQFDYLQKGKYSVFVYEDCPTCPDGKTKKLVATEITKQRSTVDLGIISEKKVKNAGTSTITGNIHAKKYDNSGTLLYEGVGQNINVYIIYGNATSYTSTVKSGVDGTFSFPNLGIDHYQVYAYSKCTTCASGVQPVIVPIDVVSDNSTVDVGQISVNN